MQKIFLSFLVFVFVVVSYTQATNLYITTTGTTTISNQELESLQKHSADVARKAELASGVTVKIPFRKETNYSITEGRFYSDAEFAIHGLRNHKAIDYAAPYGTPVIAPTTGFVLGTYQNGFLYSDSGNIQTYSGKTLNYGYGYYIVFWDPKEDSFLLMAHLASIDTKIPFYPSKQLLNKDGSLRGRNSGFTPQRGEQIKASFLADPKAYTGMKLVTPGTVLGKVGTSGLEWGMPLGTGVIHQTKSPKNPLPSRDEPHVHIEYYKRTEKGKELFDPYGVYSGANAYRK